MSDTNQTNVNKENHTLDLTENMQYGLLSYKQFINLYIKLPSCTCNKEAGFKKQLVNIKTHRAVSLCVFITSQVLLK